jgi:glycosyltransferase involved in cell wall biosynthesis
MRVCRITKQLCSDQDPGGGLHAYYLTKEMCEPTLIITRQDQGKKAPLPSYAAVKAISYQDVVFTWNLGSEFFQHGANGIRQKIAMLRKMILKLREIEFFLKSIPSLIRFKPEIVHVDGLICLLGGAFAKIVIGSRLVITLHGITEAALVKKLRLLRHLLKVCDNIICVSNAIKNTLPNFAAEKLEVIPSGVDLQLFRNLNLPRKRQLVAVGAFKWQKGYSHLIEAMTALSKLDDYRLLIIGDGPQKGQIERQIAELKLNDRVHLLGLLSQAEIVRHLNESKLFIMSSLAEGLPKVLLEAIACGTPAVVTTACNAEGIIERVGTAVEPGDGLALARAIEEILGNEEHWKKLSANCLEIAREYGWTTVAARTLEVYRRLQKAAS